MKSTASEPGLRQPKGLYISFQGVYIKLINGMVVWPVSLLSDTFNSKQCLDAMLAKFKVA